MRKCIKCGLEKSIDQFHRSKNRADGLYPNCKDCKNAANRAWKRANPQKHSANAKNWRAANVEKTKWIMIKSRYGIDQQKYEALLFSQGGVCGICKLEPGAKGFHVDHDHACCESKTACGECVRGLLCFRCNAALGGFRDSRNRLLSAVEYLDAWNTLG
jgi:hypothetical protein